MMETLFIAPYYEQLHDNENNFTEHIICYSRDGLHELAMDLCDCKIPLLVFSAGIGDIVIEVLKVSPLRSYVSINKLTNQ